MRFEETMQADAVIRAMLLRVNRNKFRRTYLRETRPYTSEFLFERIGLALRNLHEIQVYGEENPAWPMDGELFEGRVLAHLLEAVLSRLAQVYMCDSQLSALVDKWGTEPDVVEPTWESLRQSRESEPKGDAMALVSGKMVRVSLVFVVPVGMTDEQAQQVFTTAVSVRGDALSALRQVDAQVAAEQQQGPQLSKM